MKPKINRGNSQRNVSDDNDEDLTPSPIFPSKFKAYSPENHGENCMCTKCFSKKTFEQSNLSHPAICGCHECFTKECHEMKPLSKDKLINAIRNFISNKEISDNTKLETHQEDCMCKNHLIFYKKNKIAILDKFLNKQKSEVHNKLLPIDES